MFRKTKIVFTFLALLILISNQLKASDTIILVPSPRIEIKFNYCPLTYIKWSVPNYEVTYSEKNGPDNYKRGIETESFANIGVGCLYNLKKMVWIGLTFNYFTQGTSLGAKDESDQYINKYFSLETYQRVFQINACASFRIKDTKMNKSGTYFSFGIAPEFANKENQWTMILKAKDGTKLDEQQDFEKFNTKYAFVRVTPNISIIRYKYNSKSNFSFNYGSSFSFKPVYEVHKHLEYLKNYKIIPVIIGISYHFK